MYDIVGKDGAGYLPTPCGGLTLHHIFTVPDDDPRPEPGAVCGPPGTAIPNLLALLQIHLFAMHLLKISSENPRAPPGFRELVLTVDAWASRAGRYSVIFVQPRLDVSPLYRRGVRFAVHRVGFIVLEGRDVQGNES